MGIFRICIARPMGRRQGNEPSRHQSDVDFHNETQGERGDRIKGSTKGDKMHAARKSDVEEEIFTRRRHLAYGYFGCNTACVILLAVAFCTDGWYVATNSSNMLSTQGDTIGATEEWNFSLLGVGVVISYCGDGECVVERDQFRYYEQDKNLEEFRWDDYLVEDAATADTGMKQAMMCIACFGMLNLVCSSLMALVLCNIDTRCRSIASAVLCLVSLPFLGTGIWVFLLSLEDLTAQLEEKNFVFDSKPSFSWGYSTYCAFATFLPLVALMVLIIKLVRPQNEDPDAVTEAAMEQHNKRSQRTKSYFKDIENGSHIYEHTPVDSFEGKEHKRVGWTQSVDMAATNVLHGDDQVAGTPLNVIPAAIKDSLVSCTMVTPMPPRKTSVTSNTILSGIATTTAADSAQQLAAADDKAGGFNQQRCLESAAPRLPPLPGTAGLGSINRTSSELQPQGARRGSLAAKPPRTRSVTRAPVAKREERTGDVAVVHPGTSLYTSQSSSNKNSRKSSTLSSGSMAG